MKEKKSKRLVSYLIDLNVRFWLWLLKREYRFMVPLCKAIENHTDNFCRYRLNPKKASAYEPLELKTTTKEGELAVILQGEVTEKYDFTIETVKFYKKIFPGAYIIVSTWDYTTPDTIERLKEAGAIVILSHPFTPWGYGHMNFQLKTSMEGLKKAKELGAKYTLKNRSDLRIYREYSYEYLRSLLEMFPITEKGEVPLQERIITLSGYRGQLIYPYWLQDFIYFGRTEDLMEFLDVPYDSRDKAGQLQLDSNGKRLINNGKDLCDSMPPEIYITTEFFKKYTKIEYTVEKFWRDVRNYFIVIDFEDLDILWYKYDFTMRTHNFDFTYDGAKNYSIDARNINFTNFMSIYKNLFVITDEIENMRQRKFF